MSLGRILGATAAVAALTVPAVASAQQPAPPSITAAGSASAVPKPVDRTSDASIAKAVRVAQKAALPRAIADGRVQAQRLANAAGLTLGALQTITAPATAGFPFIAYGEQGTFGPGRFCGNIARYKVTRVDGKRTRKRIGTRRTCRVPSRVAASVTLTYATAPGAPVPAS